MIKSFRHKRLEAFFEVGNGKGLPANLLHRLEDLLTTMHAAGNIEQLALPSYRLHPLKGDLKGFWAITVRANWRLVFRFEEGHVFDVDFVDYH